MFQGEDVTSLHMLFKSVCITSWLIPQEDKFYDDVLLRKDDPASVIWNSKGHLAHLESSLSSLKQNYFSVTYHSE